MYAVSLKIVFFLVFISLAKGDDQKEGTTFPVSGSTPSLVDQGSTTAAPVSPLAKPGDLQKNCTSGINGTECEKEHGYYQTVKNYMMDNQGMLMRTFYVLLGVTAIVVIYFVVKTVRLRKFRNKSKRYGIISQSDDNMEMRPLDQEDDEDDMTVFDINHK